MRDEAIINVAANCSIFLSKDSRKCMHDMVSHADRNTSDVDILL